jgi:hypothetical protein
MTLTSTSRRPTKLGPAAERFLADLTTAAYEAVLKHRPQASFLDVQLDVWAALRTVVENKVAERRHRRGARAIR